jgi:hypothetical protein
MWGEGDGVLPFGGDGGGGGGDEGGAGGVVSVMNLRERACSSAVAKPSSRL